MELQRFEYQDNVEQNDTIKALAFYDFENRAANVPLDQWPAHVTIVPPFELAAPDTSALLNTIGTVAREFRPFMLEPDREDTFENGTVTLINDPSQQLKQLHAGLVRRLVKEGYGIDTRWCLDAYQPHSTHVEGFYLPTTAFCFDALSIGIKRAGIKSVERIIHL